MQYSSNYKLKLMEGTDNVKRQDFVDNFTSIDTNMKNIENKTNLYGTTNGTNTYTVSITGVSSYFEGLKVTVKIGVSSTGASSLNINGLGAKTILDSLGNAITNGGLKAGIPYTLCYNGSNFILQGKGGGGNATADKILSGYTATVDSGQITGSMANNGSINASLNCGQSKTIPAGYTTGGTITANSLSSQTQATANNSHILSGQTAWVNGSKITGNIPNRTNVGGDGGTDRWWLTKEVATGGDKLHFRPNVDNNTIAYSGDCWLSAPYSNVASALGLTANKLISGTTVCGIAGTIPNNGAVSSSLNAGGSYTIPEGYHNGQGRITANSLSSQGAVVMRSGTYNIVSTQGSDGKWSYPYADFSFLDINPYVVYGMVNNKYYFVCYRDNLSIETFKGVSYRTYSSGSTSAEYTNITEIYSKINSLWIYPYGKSSTSQLATLPVTYFAIGVFK